MGRVFICTRIQIQTLTATFCIGEQQDIASVDNYVPDAVLDRVLADPQALALLDDQDEDEAGTTGQIDAYAQQLVRGVAANRPDLDALIDQFSRRWSVARMPAVDRNVLRLAAYELQFEDTSPAVVIDEALELVKGMSTDNSARFVNGVLEAIRRHLTPANDSTG